MIRGGRSLKVATSPQAAVDAHRRGGAGAVRAPSDKTPGGKSRSSLLVRYSPTSYSVAKCDNQAVIAPNTHPATRPWRTRPSRRLNERPCFGRSSLAQRRGGVGAAGAVAGGAIGWAGAALPAEPSPDLGCPAIPGIDWPPIPGMGCPAIPGMEAAGAPGVGCAGRACPGATPFVPDGCAKAE